MSIQKVTESHAILFMTCNYSNALRLVELKVRMGSEDLVLLSAGRLVISLFLFKVIQRFLQNTFSLLEHVNLRKSLA